MNGPAAGEVRAPLSPGRVAVRMLAAHVCAMAGFASFAALLPELRDLWRLSNSEAGLVGGAFFIGYVGTVSFWTALTDRTLAGRVYLTGTLLTFAGSAGFGLFAHGFASAVIFQTLLGAGIAATYMPGLRILSDRVSGSQQSRYIAFYTSFFGIGTALSLALAGWIGAVWGWRVAFVAAAFGPLVAALLAAPVAPPATAGVRIRDAFVPSELFPLAAWRRVLSHRSLAGYALGYAAHCMELFGSRAWMVAFLVFSAGLQVGGASFPWSAAAIAAVVNVLAVPASIVGNEVALRIGRRPWILIAMLGSSVSGIVLGLAAAAHWTIVFALIVFYSVMVMAESATLTAGMVAAAPPNLRGAALGLYSLAGFAGGMVGPVVFGAALDLAGGAGLSLAWAGAYAAIGAGCLVAPLAVRLFGARGAA